MEPHSQSDNKLPNWSQPLQFAAFNALSFQIVLGAPMLLYAKGLNASATELGLITGLMPLLVVLQIPAAKHVHRFGYKRFVLAGWSVRTAFILLIAVVPLLGLWIDDRTKFGINLILLFLFNAVRGISSCAWLPWISSIIPGPVRGRFLLREAAMINIASIGCVLLAALMLGNDPNPGRFASLFFISAAAGFVSLLSLSRIPEEEDASSLLDSVTPVGVGLMIQQLAFRRLLWVNIAWGLASGGVLAFAIAFLKVAGGLNDGRILLHTSAMFLGGLCTLGLLHRVVDSIGSRPILIGAAVLWLGIMSLWTLVASGILPLIGVVIFTLMFLIGFGTSIVNLANIRLAMDVIPERGRSHYFVVFSVVGNLILGLAPIAWGTMIDQCSRISSEWHAFEINRFSIAFAAMTIAFAVLLATAWRLIETDSTKFESMLREILTRSRLRHWLRLWPRG